MKETSDVLQFVSAGGFAFLSLAAWRRWSRRRDGVDATIAGALALLATTAILGLVSEATGYRHRILQHVSFVAFLGSGWLLVEFRHRFLPLRPAWRIAAAAAALGAAALTIAARLPYGASPTFKGADAAVLFAVIGVWGGSVLEPIVRFARASTDRPHVQRARLRALAFAYGAMIAILVVAISVGSSDRPAVALGLQAAALALIPVLQAAIAPPRWLRRVWRAPEQQAMKASRELVMFAPDRAVMAGRALHWAVRLVGGTAGFLSTEKLQVVAQSGMSHDEACELAASLRAREAAASVNLPRGRGTGIAVPVRTDSGVLTLAVLSGPFVGLFGSDEIELLGEYASEVGVALDRVRLTSELHRLDAARREFIANAAHELRTPLTAILGFSSMLAEDPPRLPPEQTGTAFKMIHRHALRMRLLVNNLLDLAQIEQGKLSVTVQPISLETVVQRAVENTPPPDDREIKVQVPDVEVLADPFRLEQVVSNLLTNAFKYGGKDVRIEAVRNGPTATVAVVDDGAGIPEAARANLFEPFMRGEGTSGVQGSGLGLAIVRSLVQAFGGTIWYEDAEPGARFVFTLQVTS